MPAVDRCHDQVIRALQKDGWIVERAPFNLVTLTRTAYIDLQMSRKINGTNQQMMVVEVKCFPEADTTTYDVYASLGQYLVYQAMMMQRNMPYPLYLAVPSKNFDKIFDEAVMTVVKKNRVNLILIDLDDEVIVQWKQF